MSKESTTPAEEEKTPEAVPEEKKPEEESLGDALGEEADTSTDDDDDDDDSQDKPTVGLDKHMKVKNKLKDAKARIAELEAGNGDDDDDDDSDDTPSTTSKPEVDVEALVDKKLQPIVQERRNQERDARFDALYGKTLTDFPEYDGIADKETIKQLALNPANKNKTMSQILESVYGGLIQGRPSVDANVPPAQPASGSIDYDKAEADPEYYKQLMADPKLKKEYNDSLPERLAGQM